MWTKIDFVTAVRRGAGKRVLQRREGVYVSLADAPGVVLDFEDGSRLAAVSRCLAKPYDVDNDPVDGETEPTVTLCSPDFYLWEE